MKKLISLSLVATFTIMTVFAQDTIPQRPLMPDSMKSSMDSMKWKNPTDTSMFNNDSMHMKMGDTTMKKWSPDSSLNKSWKGDSTGMNHSMNSDSLSTMAGSDSLNSKTSSTMDNSSATTTTTTTSVDSSTALSDRVIMRDDSMFVVKNGEFMPMDMSYTLESGAVITKEGKVKYPSGKEVQLKNGQFIETSDKDKGLGEGTTTTEKMTKKTTKTRKKKTT